jgi:hypothetical protein
LLLPGEARLSPAIISFIPLLKFRNPRGDYTLKDKGFLIDVLQLMFFVGRNKNNMAGRERNPIVFKINCSLAGRNFALD